MYKKFIVFLNKESDFRDKLQQQHIIIALVIVFIRKPLDTSYFRLFVNVGCRWGSGLTIFYFSKLKLFLRKFFKGHGSERTVPGTPNPRGQRLSTIKRNGAREGKLDFRLRQGRHKNLVQGLATRFY